ncbi:MAG: hypothetical protein KBF28_00460 [Gemmatimonadales bacterium]|jgi:hypothetical protein|nr:hypothetical protein [Gemmatimonadales bacterium]
MAESFELDVKTLVRVLVNDPSARALLEEALRADPMPVREPVFLVSGGGKVYAARVRTDRSHGPGEAGFIARDARGFLSGSLTEQVAAEHDAKTMSQDQLAKHLGITVEELEARLKP